MSFTTKQSLTFCLKLRNDKVVKFDWLTTAKMALEIDFCKGFTKIKVINLFTIDNSHQNISRSIKKGS